MAAENIMLYCKRHNIFKTPQLHNELSKYNEITHEYLLLNCRFYGAKCDHEIL